jgi:hypothetical protein
MVFHPYLHFSISFEILNEVKLIHHYVNGNSYRIDPAFNVLPPKSILVVTVYISLFHLSFQMQIYQNVVAGDQGIN